MQTTATTAQATVRIMVPAGAAILGSYGVFTAKAAFETDAEGMRGVITDGGGKVILRGVISYVFTRGESVYTVSALQAHPVVSPEPEPTSEPPTTARRQSREGQRNARAEMAYRTMRYLGGVATDDVTMEQWSVPSTSQADVAYTVTHDLAHDRFHCSCEAGIHSRQCVHVLAAMRKVNDRRVQWEQEQRGGYGYNDTYNLHMGTQATSDWD